MKHSKFMAIRSSHLLKNIGGLTLLQFSNFAIPLIVLPILARRLGPEQFGLAASILAALNILFVITDYGFTLSATYQLAKNKSDSSYINKKIGAIWSAKALILAAISAIYGAYLLFHSTLEHKHYILAVAIAVIPNAFISPWFYHGVNRVGALVKYTLLSRAVYAALVYFYLDEGANAILVVYFWAAAQWICFIGSTYYIFSLGYRPRITPFRAIAEELVGNSQYFLSRLAVTTYTSASIIVVGAIAGGAQAGLYYACDQLYKAGQNATGPINTALFPYMAEKANWKIFFRMLAFFGSMVIIGCFSAAIFAEDILVIIFGPEYANAKEILLVFLIISAVNYFGVALGYSPFAALGKLQHANNSVIYGAVIHVILLSILYFTDNISPMYVAYAVLITETLVLFYRATALHIIKSRSR